MDVLPAAQSVLARELEQSRGKELKRQNTSTQKSWFMQKLCCMGRPPQNHPERSMQLEKRHRKVAPQPAPRPLPADFKGLMLLDEVGQATETVKELDDEYDEYEDRHSLRKVKATHRPQMVS